MNICTMKQMGSGPLYLNLISSFGFKSHIDKPTRVMNNSLSCLDHVLIRNSKKFRFACNVIELGITDHYAISAVLSNDCYKVNEKPTSYHKILDEKMLRRQLQAADWINVFNDNDVNISVDQLYAVYNKCYSASCYLKKHNSQTRKRKPWVTNELLNLINRKNLSFKKFSKNKDDQNLKLEYKTLSNLVTHKIRQEKINYYSSLIEKSEGDKKQYWSVVGKIRNKNKKSISSINIGNNKIQVRNNEVEVANYFNDYFVNIISKLKNKAFGCDLFNEVEEDHEVKFENFRIREEDVKNTIIGMKSKKSSGLDGINIITVKNNLDLFVPLLHCIFSRSLCQGIFPDAFKTAAVVPVFKSGDQAEVSSYRPISLISTIGKIFEILIKEKLMSYFTESNIISENQFGFVPHKGTDLAVEKHVNSIVGSIEKNNFTLALYLDFQKAFDTVDIRLLIEKLKKYGIGGNLLRLLITFCKNRSQVVKINKLVGNVSPLHHGVAQGGVLGPLMFVIYINDLLNLRLNSRIFAYADDTALVCSAYTRQALKMKILADLECISGWLIDNKLLINTSKSKCILFFDTELQEDFLTEEFSLLCHLHQCLYECKCEHIRVVDSVKYLGLHIDKNLNWDKHVKHLTNKIKAINYSIYYMREFLRKEHLLQLYHSWVESTIRYGIIHYGGTYKNILKPLILAQRFALRTVFFIKKFERVSYIFEENKILTFHQLFCLSCLMHVQKFLNNYSFKEYRRVTRSARLRTLNIENFLKEKCRNQFSYIGKKIFNKAIVLCGNGILNEKKPKFKMKMKNLVLTNVFDLA